MKRYLSELTEAAHPSANEMLFNLILNGRRITILRFEMVLLSILRLHGCMLVRHRCNYLCPTIAIASKMITLFPVSVVRTHVNFKSNFTVQVAPKGYYIPRETIDALELAEQEWLKN